MVPFASLQLSISSRDVLAAVGATTITSKDMDVQHHFEFKAGFQYLSMMLYVTCRLRLS